MKIRVVKYSVLLAVFSFSISGQTLTPSQDAYFVPANGINYGTAPTVTVGSMASVGLVQFDLTQLPAGLNANQIAKATLSLFTDHVGAPGTVSIYFVNGAWTEIGVSGATAPATGAVVAPNVPVSSTNGYVTVDATAAVASWIAGTTPNNGFLIQADADASVQFDSKENINTSHPPALTISLVGIAGPAGPQGPQGPGGPQGPTGGTAQVNLGLGLTLDSMGAVAVDPTVVPELTTINNFLQNQTINGLLGIGTNSPGSQLEIKGVKPGQDGSGNGLSARSVVTISGGAGGDGSASGGAGAEVRVTAGSGGAGKGASAAGGNGGSITLQPGAGGAGASQGNAGNILLAPNALGFVGVGTPTPAFALDVNGDARVSGTLHFSGNQSFPIADGTITNSMLANSGATLNAGPGLAGGGAFTLGGAAALSVDPLNVPFLGIANLFRASQSFQGPIQLWNSTPARFYTDAGSTLKGFMGPSLVDDLSVISETNGNWLRFGANNGSIAFWTNGHAETDSLPALALTPTGLNFYNGTRSIYYSDAGINTGGVVGPGGNQDMSVVSRIGGRFLRLGTNNSDIAFWTDGNAEDGKNSSPQMRLSPNGLFVDYVNVTHDLSADSLFAANNVFVNGSCLAGKCSSDIRLKKDIQAFSPVLSRLALLQPVSWNWKTDEYPEYHFGSSRAFGLIAQDVEKVFPDMVSTDARGYKMVNYTQLPYLMLQAIGELKTANDELKRDLERFRRDRDDVRQLRLEIEQLKAAFNNSSRTSLY